MIEVDSRYPCNRGVATVALLSGQDVIRRLRRCANTAADAVACGAIARRAFENGSGVALLAWQVAVAPGQLEAGCEMVELGALLGSETGWRQRECGQKCEEQGNCTHVIALAQASALEGEGAMALLTLASVLAQVYVIL